MWERYTGQLRSRLPKMRWKTQGLVSFGLVALQIRITLGEPKSQQSVALSKTPWYTSRRQPRVAKSPVCHHLSKRTRRIVALPLRCQYRFWFLKDWQSLFQLLWAKTMSIPTYTTIIRRTRPKCFQLPAPLKHMCMYHYNRYSKYWGAGIDFHSRLICQRTWTDAEENRLLLILRCQTFLSDCSLLLSLLLFPCSVFEMPRNELQLPNHGRSIFFLWTTSFTANHMVKFCHSASLRWLVFPPFAPRKSQNHPLSRKYSSRND